MRSDIIRIYKAVHTWTGIVSSMALFIAFYAGALTLFKEPLTRWASPPATPASMLLADADKLIAQTLPVWPSVAKDFQLHLRPDEPITTASLTWYEPDPAADEHDQLSGRHFSAALDNNGRVSVTEQHPAKLTELIDTLHRVIGLPVDNDASRWLMGSIAILYALALISGLILLLPTLVRDFFALRLGKNLKRMWLDAHNVVGITGLPFHMLMALTAATFAYHDGIHALQDWLFHTKSPAVIQSATPLTSDVHDPAMLLPSAELLERAQALSATFEPTLLQYVQTIGPKPQVRIWGHDETAISLGSRGGFVVLDPYDGYVISSHFLPGHQTPAYTTASSFFALHFASYGGTAVRWTYFVLGLAGAWLFYSGNLLWIESRRRCQRQGEALPVQRRDVCLMGSATVGVCLGCMGGISLTIVASKWLFGHVTSLKDWHLYLYYTTFFVSIAWAFWRGAANAAVDLLWGVALLTLAIPMTTLLAWMLPGVGWWGHTDIVSLGVDLTALVGGLCLILMARRTAWRVRTGPPDSLWSATEWQRPSQPN